MTSNFQIIQHHNSDNLHLRLVGVFDGSSAMELVNIIREHAEWYNKIFVHTSGLSKVLSFGEALFIKHCPLKKFKANKLVITGEYSEKLTNNPFPENQMFQSDEEGAVWRNEC